MLSTLIYRSHTNKPMSSNELQSLLASARQRNAALNVTGILLFNGIHFVQLLEGSVEAVTTIFNAINSDKRHDKVVILMRDQGPSRRFQGDAMAGLDLRVLTPTQVSALIFEKMSKQAKLASSDDRVVKLLEWYAFASGATHIIDGDTADDWHLVETSEARSHDDPDASTLPYQFALQPIVNPSQREITSFEFLIRSQSGGSPEQFFSSLEPEQRYLVDLESKASAFMLAHRLNLKNVKLSVNLLPMSLIGSTSAVDRLVEQIIACELSPQQVIVEITEQEAVANLGDFRAAIERLRLAGIGVAIDDFGAGFAGLSLLAEFQPDKLKIDRYIIQNIHQDGARQAIVRAIAYACNAMGILPVAEGVELIEEWSWLREAGIERFQGYLFARPALNSIPNIRWPERVLPG